MAAPTLSRNHGTIGTCATELEHFTLTCKRCGSTDVELFLDWGVTDCDVKLTCIDCDLREVTS